MATIQTKLKPFSTPNFVSIELPPRPRECGMIELPSIALKDLDEDTLSQLCEEFRQNVFRKAGKKDPKVKNG